MGSLTTWNRLEPRTRSESLPGLAARVGDPLWLLGRQDQVGELTGSDTASIVSATIAYEVAPITRWAAGTPAAGDNGTPLPHGVPLESLVDAVTDPVGRRERAAAGSRFLRFLGDDLVREHGEALRREFAVSVLSGDESSRSDDLGVRRAALLGGRAIDGLALRLAPAFPDPSSVRERIGVRPITADAFDRALDAFGDWWDARHPLPTGAWQADRLAAPFALGARTASGAVTLHAPDHRGGRVDWHTFDVGSGTLGAGDPAPVPTGPLTVLPGRLAFPGMPSSRWWEFENRAVDLGRLEAAPDDLGRLLLAEFALVYGNDFFVVPLTVPAGSLTRITRLEVLTTYGERVTIPRAGTLPGRRPWRMFEIDGDTEGRLLIAPCAVDVLDGPVAEEVLFTRDEAANLAWGIEMRVPGPAGGAVERRQVEAEQAPAPVRTSTQRYRLASTVPDSWLPLVPVEGGESLEQKGGGPVGTLLTQGSPFRLVTSELPRVGRRVTRRSHLARATDGTRRVWSSWAARSGRAESSSGLSYDELTDVAE
ncbi:MAG: hypothetical protein IPJ14_19195 [Kineosporiaceae bacterium]|nr:hypothetical protein [Kineosporiaceae bacterium]